MVYQSCARGLRVVQRMLVMSCPRKRAADIETMVHDVAPDHACIRGPSEHRLAVHWMTIVALRAEAASSLPLSLV
jgi:hypothetical protein